MKTRNIFTILALAALTMVSCNNKGNDTVDRVAVNFSSTIAETKAANDKWSNGDKIGITMFNAGTTTVVDAVDNTPYTTTGDGKFTNANTIYYPIDGSKRDFLAYYPYVAAITNYTYKVDVADQSSQPKIDLMYAKATGNDKNNPNVVLEFVHKLSKIEFVISAGVGLTAEDIKGLKIEITGVNTKADFDIKANTLGNISEPKNITPLTKADGTAAEAIVLTEAAKAGRTFVFTAKINDVNEIFYWSIPADKEFKSGEKNIYNVKLVRTGVEITSTIKPWTEGNNGGEIIDAE